MEDLSFWDYGLIFLSKRDKLTILIGNGVLKILLGETKSSPLFCVGGKHVQGTGATACVIFDGITWLHDPFSYPFPPVKTGTSVEDKIMHGLVFCLLATLLLLERERHMARSSHF